jgi:hypothetical protein
LNRIRQGQSVDLWLMTEKPPPLAPTVPTVPDEEEPQ